MSDVISIYENIIGNVEDTVLEIPLTDLIWTIVVFSQQMSDCEQEAFKDYPYYPLDKTKEYVDGLLREKEYTACRRDELARLISQYSSFDIQKIWDEVDKLFKEY